MFEKELAALKRKGLLRDIVARASAQGPVITIYGKSYINFASNDYLGLANHPAVITAVKKSVGRSGVGSGASRLLAGGSTSHSGLEALVSEFKGTETALIMNSGYAANTGILPAIAGPGDLIFSDALNHASIIDGCRLSSSRTVVYPHKDMAHLERLLKREKASGRRIVATDTVFSMDGDIAPLGNIAELCRRHSAMLYIDDAHATGVLGNGRGGLAHFGLPPAPWMIQVGTFSKAFGSFGAFAAGSRSVIAWIHNTARSFMFSTALPACLVDASAAALRLIRDDPMLIRKLWLNRELLATGIRSAGGDILGSESPIIPVRAGGIRRTLRLAAFLRDRGIYAPVIRPPAVKEPRIRVTVSAGHTNDQICRLIELLREFRL